MNLMLVERIYLTWSFRFVDERLWIEIKDGRDGRRNSTEMVFYANFWDDQTGPLIDICNQWMHGNSETSISSLNRFSSYHQH
jgi:hypothetical protein